MSIERVGIIGAGQMGAGIAEVSARAGVDVLVASAPFVPTANVAASATKVARTNAPRSWIRNPFIDNLSFRMRITSSRYSTRRRWFRAASRSD